MTLNGVQEISSPIKHGSFSLLTKRRIYEQTSTHFPSQPSCVLHVLSVYLTFSDFATLTEYCAGDKIEKNEMGEACGTYRGRERGAQGSGGET